MYAKEMFFTVPDNETWTFYEPCHRINNTL